MCEEGTVQSLISVLICLWDGGDPLAPGQPARLQEYDTTPKWIRLLTTAPDTRLRVVLRIMLENLCDGPISSSEAGKHPIPVALKQD